MFNPSVLLSRALQIVVSLYGGESAPIVSLGSATIIGVNNQDSPATQSFLGIPFAAAPRFDLPRPVPAYVGNIDASAYGPACIQQDVMATVAPIMKVIMGWLKIKNLIPVPEKQSEDCLSISIVRPATATSSSRLPVVAWIYGGGFLFGDSQTWHSMGEALVEKSIEKGEDVIYVSFNYRLSAYGFLAGHAMKESDAGNVGLQDQREALRWIQKYIHNFGGDPERVILWGESAGAISASLHMLAHDGDTSGLFHGVFAHSGGPPPVTGLEKGQPQFDALANAVGCDDKGKELEKLQCLRSIPLEKLRAAVDATDGILSNKSLVLTWHPRADGKFLTDNPYKLIEQGKFSRVPLVTGNVDDEGTLFTLALMGDLFYGNETMAWIKKNWAPITEKEQVLLNTYYPDDGGVSGSPFNTPRWDTWPGNKQYKRVAAFQGDMVFQAPRRFFAQGLCNNTKVWVYLSKQWKDVFVLGSHHGSDFNIKESQYLALEYVSKFANSFDPNLGGDVKPWPLYQHPNPKLYLFPKKEDKDDKSFPPPEVTYDDHREGGFKFLTELAKKYPL